MTRTNYTHFLSLFFLFFICVLQSDAQTFEFIPSPSNYDNPDAGYSGLPIVFDSDLYLSYENNDDGYDLVQFDGSTLTPFPSPIGYAGNARGYRGDPIIMGGVMYLKYQKSDGNYNLFKHDGTTLTEIPSPEGYGDIPLIDSGYKGQPIVFNNELYLQYKADNGTLTLFKYDGSNLIEITNPNGYNSSEGYSGYYGHPVVYGANLYLRYTQDNGNWDLIKYDGTNFTIIDSPPGYDADYDGYLGFPYVHGTDLFLKYDKSGGNDVLFKYDGTTLIEIPSPVGYDGNSAGYVNNPIVYNSELYLKYEDNDGNYDLMKYDGTDLISIPSPSGYDDSGKGYFGSPIVMGSELFLRYHDNDGSYELFKCDGVNLSEVTSPGGYNLSGVGYLGSPIVIGTKLYLHYKGDDSNSDLFLFEDNTLTELSSPAGYTGWGNGYQGSPISTASGLYLAFVGDDDRHVLCGFEAGCDDSSSSFSVTECSEYTTPSGDETYTTEGTYTVMDTISNMCGADSVMTISLTILPELTGSLSTSICNNESIEVNGTVYDASNPSGIEVFSGIGEFECDSTVTVNLVVLDELTGSITNTICYEDSIEVNGTIYNASNPSGIEVFTGIGEFECDSTVIIDLTILAALTGFEGSTICNNESIEVNGTIYDASNPSGVEVFSGIGEFACDSIVTIDLNVLPPLSGLEGAAICYDGSVEVNGTIYDASNPTGEEVFEGVGEFGCDSIVSVNLFVLEEITGSISDSLCYDESITVNGTVYDVSNPSGVEVFTGVGEFECDSTVTIELSFTTIDSSTTTNGPEISSNQIDATYVWIDCENGNAIIEGETDISFTAIVNGEFAVMVTSNGCTDTSDCVSITGIDVGENDLDNIVQLYPNPSSDIVYIDFGDLRGVHATVSNILGEEVFRMDDINEPRVEISLSEWSNGMYFVQIGHEEQMKTVRLIKD